MSLIFSSSTVFIAGRITAFISFFLWGGGGGGGRYFGYFCSWMSNIHELGRQSNGDGSLTHSLDSG